MFYFFLTWHMFTAEREPAFFPCYLSTTWKYIRQHFYLVHPFFLCPVWFVHFCLVNLRIVWKLKIRSAPGSWGVFEYCKTEQNCLQLFFNLLGNVILHCKASMLIRLLSESGPCNNVQKHVIKPSGNLN